MTLCLLILWPYKVMHDMSTWNNIIELYRTFIRIYRANPRAILSSWQDNFDPVTFAGVRRLPIFINVLQYIILYLSAQCDTYTGKYCIKEIELHNAIVYTIRKYFYFSSRVVIRNKYGVKIVYVNYAVMKYYKFPVL